MLQLILHGIGDYFLQTDKQALGKKKPGRYGFKCCLIHCVTYSLPFLFIGSWMSVLVIFITHFIVDRTNIIAWALAYKNGIRTIENFGYSPERPFAISIWLFIICDNLTHIICNYLALKETCNDGTILHWPQYKENWLSDWKYINNEGETFFQRQYANGFGYESVARECIENHNLKNQIIAIKQYDRTVKKTEYIDIP